MSAIASNPLASELLRKQQTFNTSIVRALGAFRGIPRLADPDPAAYPASLAEHEAQRQAAELPSGTTSISLLTPTFRTPPDVLRACVDSVLAQSYPHWQLCLVDDGSKDPQLGALLECYAARDPRIRVQLNQANAGIAPGSWTSERANASRASLVLPNDSSNSANVSQFLASSPGCVPQVARCR